MYTVHELPLWSIFVGVVFNELCNLYCHDTAASTWRIVMAVEKGCALILGTQRQNPLDGMSPLTKWMKYLRTLSLEMKRKRYFKFLSPFYYPSSHQLRCTFEIKSGPRRRVLESIRMQHATKISVAVRTISRAIANSMYTTQYIQQYIMQQSHHFLNVVAITFTLPSSSLHLISDPPWRLTVTHLTDGHVC